MEMTTMIQQTKDAIAEYEVAAGMLRGVILGQGFVVKCDGVFLTFDIDALRRVHNPRPSQPHRAVRFTRADAWQIAGSIKNGNGSAGEVVHVRLAVDEALANQCALLAMLEAHQQRIAEQIFTVEADQ